MELIKLAKINDEKEEWLIDKRTAKEILLKYHDVKRIIFVLS